MLVECRGCGAPLDVRPEEDRVVCRYCGRSSPLRSLKTMSPETPAGWRPPATWEPQPRSPRVAVACAPVAVSGCLAVFFGAVLFLVGLLTTVPATTPTSAPAISGLELLSPTSSWDGTTPFRCGGNQSVVLEGVTADLGRETAITIESNCTAEIRNVRIEAWEGVQAGGNGRVVIRDSVIVARGTAITATGNKRVQLVDSTVTAEGYGVEASGNARLTVSGGQVVGSPAAVHTRSNARLEVRDALLVDQP